MAGADSEYELYKAISDDPVVLPADGPITAAARELLVGSEANGWRGMFAKDAASRMTIVQIRESDFVTQDGTKPLPASLHVRNCRLPPSSFPSVGVYIQPCPLYV